MLDEVVCSVYHQAMLYHKDVYIPPKYQDYQFAALLKYSRHAMREASADKRGAIRLPKVIDSRNATLIELEVDNDKVVKVVYRVDYNDKHDLCLVVVPDDRFVKTVWLNDRGDNHGTLRRERYAKECCSG